MEHIATKVEPPDAADKCGSNPYPQAGKVVGSDTDKIPAIGHFNAGGPPFAANHHVEALPAMEAAVVVGQIKADVVAVCLLVKNQCAS